LKINNEKFWKDKMVFVTGGAGFIGKHLVKKLIELGAGVKVFAHIQPKGIQDPMLFWGDLVEHKSSVELHDFLLSYKPDVVFHLAAQPLVNDAEKRLIETLDINIRGTYNLMYACVGVPSIQSIVHISTDKVYGNLDLITEKDLPNGVEHPYNTSKLSADLLVQMFANTFDLPITIIRNGNIYGAGDIHWERIIPGNIRRVLYGKSPIIRGDGNMLRDYIYVKDIVMGFINAAEHGWGTEKLEILRLGSPKSYSVVNVIDAILSISNRIDLAPEFEDTLKGEIKNQHILDPVTQEKIGWYPEIGLEVGLALTIPAYREYFEDMKNV
jgi:CDP-glucose 4,6-dehydratase